ncbi:MAG: hypothetical protein ACP5LM_05610, partial [Thermoplasmata archaeon]
IVLGANLDTDFKNISDTRAGIFIGWQPEIYNRPLNLLIGIGPTYGKNNITPQILLMFNIW